MEQLGVEAVKLPLLQATPTSTLLLSIKMRRAWARESKGIKRENLFVTSRFGHGARGYDKTLKAFDKTLSDLGLDLILDLYLIHWPANDEFGKDANQLNVDTWKAMERLDERALFEASVFPTSCSIIRAR